MLCQEHLLATLKAQYIYSQMQTMFFYHKRRLTSKFKDIVHGALFRISIAGPNLIRLMSRNWFHHHYQPTVAERKIYFHSVLHCWYIQLHYQEKPKMAANGVESAVLEEAVNKAQEAVERQGDIVRGLKAELKDGRVVRVSLYCASSDCVWFPSPSRLAHSSACQSPSRPLWTKPSSS